MTNWSLPRGGVDARSSNNRREWPVKRVLPPVHSPISATALLAAAARASNDKPLQELRELLLSEFEADSATLTASGTQALQLAMEIALDHVGGQRLIALPALSCYDLITAAAGVRSGVKVTFYDVDPDSLSPDLTSLESALIRGAGVVVAAPLFGMPLAWDRLEALADRYGALTIEDAAQGQGARWQGRRLGTLGRISVLSFGRGKGWTGGGGGALLTRRFTRCVDLHSLAGPRRNAGTMARAAAQWLLARPGLYAVPAALPRLGLGETRYRAPVRPAAMPSTAAALLIATRVAAIEEAELRIRRGSEFRTHLQGMYCMLSTVPAAEPGYLRFALRVRDGATAVPHLRPLGIAASYPTTLPQLPQAQPLIMPETPRRYPGAETLVRDLITLPTHSHVSAVARDEILTAVSSLARD